MIKTLFFTVLFLLLGYFLVSSLVGKLILFAIFLFFLAFLFYSSKIKDKYGISMIVGQIGVGKSSIICHYILKYIKEGWNVYADFETNIPGCRLFNARDLDRFVPEPDSVLFLDEASLVFFSRDFKNFAKYTEFIAKCRHYKCKIYMSSQSFDIDLYIRNRVASMYLVKRIGCISYMRRIRKLQTVLSAESLSNSQDVKNSGLIDGYKYAGILEHDSIHFFWLPRLWKWHDSFYVEDKPDIPYTVPTSSDPFVGQQWYHRLWRKLLPAAEPHDDASEEQPPEAEDFLPLPLDFDREYLLDDDDVPRIRR